MASSKLHVAMFPWFAFGHFIPYLHLAIKLAERGHRVSYLLPKGVKPNLEQLNHYPNLIHFFPLVVPPAEGLPPGAETASQVPLSLHLVLATALDKTRDQVERILSTLKPDVIFFDFGSWIPEISRQLGAKSIFFALVNAATLSFFIETDRRIAQGIACLEELIRPPPGYPSSNVVIKRSEAPHIFKLNDLAFIKALVERITCGIKKSDAIALRTCREIEGAFCDYLSEHYSKPVLVTGHILPESPAARLEEKWESWLNKFEVGSVVFCALGSQITLKKEVFQELVLGLELCGLPFLVGVTPPEGCSTIEEALPEGFEERVGERGWVYGGWVPQTLILANPSVGCFVSHCGHGSLWESLLSDCQIVLIASHPDHFLGTRLMVDELKVAVDVEGGVECVAKESLSKAIKSVMDKDSEVGYTVKANHAKWRKILSSKDCQDEYIDNFIQNLQELSLAP